MLAPECPWTSKAIGWVAGYVAAVRYTKPGRVRLLVSTAVPLHDAEPEEAVPDVGAVVNKPAPAPTI